MIFLIIKCCLLIYIGDDNDPGWLSIHINDNDMHDIGRFLNRILGIAPETQNRFVFCELNASTFSIWFNTLNVFLSTGYLSYF